MSDNVMKILPRLTGKVIDRIEVCSDDTEKLYGNVYIRFTDGTTLEVEEYGQTQPGELRLHVYEREW